jgi:hypothetical protein
MNYVAIVNVSSAGTVVHYFAVTDDGTRRLVARKIEFFVLTTEAVTTEVSFERPLEDWEMERMPQ